MVDHSRLLRKLEVDFSDSALFRQALTHRSADSRNNERLEFLGDAVLGLTVSEALYRRFPQADEGELSRYRARLVRRETLAEVGRELDLGEYLYLGSGELKSGGFRRDSILADALESIIGAVYLDVGFEKAAALVLRVLGERIDELEDVDELKDAKTRLQEYLQARQRELPEYEVSDVRGQPHDQIFSVICRIPGFEHVVAGEGSSRRRAEQQAAQRALALLSDAHDE